jgi:hypothetical protein
MDGEHDTRIPVSFGAPTEAAVGAALLIEGDTPAPAGRPSARFIARAAPGHGCCVCCVPRAPAAEALNRLFVAAARGGAPLLRSVLAVPSTALGAAAIRAAVLNDPLVQGRFRWVERDWGAFTPPPST